VRHRRLVEQARPPVHEEETAPAEARAVVSYTLVPDEQIVRGPEEPGIPSISVSPHPPVINLELRLSPAMKSSSYTAELKTFAGDRVLMTQSLLRPRQTSLGPVIEIMFPADLVEPDNYYSIYLQSPDTSTRFTFKVTADR